MPRSGGGIYSAPVGTTAVSGTTIDSAPYNAFIADLVTDANAARPISAGGTGAANAAAALTNLGAAALAGAAFTGAVTSATGIGNCGNSALGNTNVGANALTANTTGNANTATGASALAANTTGAFNTAAGFNALAANTTGAENTATGASALAANTTGAFNTAAGVNALAANTTGAFNTAAGVNALAALTTQSNCSALGANTAITGSNQVQLGDAATTTYVYGTVQNRSDARDKADVRDTKLGLDFVLSLRPVDFRYDMRDSYKPERPAQPDADATPEQVEAYEAAMAEWLEAVKLKNITHDGSKKRSRYHSGVIAQELRTAIDAAGFDAKGWGALQDHSIGGGDDVLSVGYDQFVAPLIKAIQELSAKVEKLEADAAKKVGQS